MTDRASSIVLIVHYFPPINSSGAKRMEAMAKYFARAGRYVTVIATSKKSADGEFTEAIPAGIRLFELDWLGRNAPTHRNDSRKVVPPSGRKSSVRKIKDFVMTLLGQLPDPRLPFALSFFYPWFSREAKLAIQRADIVVATTPPWPPLLAAIIVRWRYGKKIILDYRDQFSMCHEMPGGAFAKRLEIMTDRFLARRANAVVTISKPMGDYYLDFHPELAVILNGYDAEALDAAKSRSRWTPRSEDKPIVIRYLGLVSEGRIPRSMLTALSELRVKENVTPNDFVFEYYGEVDLQIAYLKSHHPDLMPFFRFLPRVSYGRSLELAASADYLLFCENSIPPKAGEDKSAQGILTTKLFEYLASGRPVIAHISEETLAGSFIRRASEDHLVTERHEDFVAFFSADSFSAPKPVETTDFVRSLSRSEQAVQYLQVLDAVTTSGGLPSAQKHSLN